MFELFLNPWSMVAGAALVSSPLIIHLINRMKYRRVRWAAMEFLLKSQKRTRRKLIIEQLILLLLRILIVLLLGILLARFLGFNPSATEEAKSTLHLVLLDDTPSMGDTWRQDGQLTDSFALAKQQMVESIARAASQASTAQELQVIRLSDLDNPRSFERLNAASIQELNDYLQPLTPTMVHVPLQKGLEAAQALLTERKDMARTLHVLSDFRSVDWGSSSQQDLRSKFSELEDAQIRVHLIDVADPERKPTVETPLYHDNIGIVDLRPETRIAAKFAPVEFIVDVANFSNSERKNVRVAVKLNGVERAEASVNLPSLPPNQVTSGRFTLTLDRVGSEEAPLERFNLVSANLEQEDAGLNIDNVRYAVVEVRDRVPILLVEGDRLTSDPQQADSYHLATLFREAIDGYQVDVRRVQVLESPNLQQYASIMLANVRDLSDKAQQNLTEYIRLGGGVAFFVGPSVRPEFYNELYAEGKGIFPVPLAETPSEPLTPEQRQERVLSFEKKIYPRESNHPAVNRLFADASQGQLSSKQYDALLHFVVIDRYYPVPRLKWKNPEGKIHELLTFPNDRPMADYEARTRALLDRLPMEDREYQRFQPALKQYSTQLKQIAASSQPLFKLSNTIEAFLQDRGSDQETARPNLQEFWQQPAIAPLREAFSRFLQDVRYGDPLYIARSYGAGRVIAFLTTANSQWNDLNGYGKAYFPPLMVEMQRYLASAGTDVNRSVGTPYQVDLDPEVYAAKVQRFFLSEAAEGVGQGRTASGFVERGEQILPSAAGQLQLSFDEAKQPGVYLFALETKPVSANQTPQAEYQAVTFNLNTDQEGNLRRINRSELLKTAPGAELHTVNEDWTDALAPKQSDWSEKPWIYLVLLGLLLAEQAMAVRLSFHTRPSEPTAS